MPRFTIILAGLILSAIVLRAASFGDPVANIDDEFYLLVGQRMHEGLSPYVDIWDRKPPGIFLTYYLIAAFSVGPLLFHVVAAIFVAGTGFVVYLITRTWTGEQGASLSAILYLVMLGPLAGGNGQTAVFYNLFTATGFLLILRERYALAMLCLGTALTFKQTVIFEAVALGLYAAAVSGWRNAPTLALLGALPFLIVSLPFLGPEYFQALVTSSLSRDPPDSPTVIGHGLDLARRLPLLTLAAGLGLCFSGPRRLLLLWLAAAIAGVVVVPQLYIHYGIPLVLPLSVAAASALDRRAVGPALALVVAAYSLLFHDPWQFEAHWRSTEAMREAVRVIDGLPGDDLLVIEGPPALYTMTGRRTLTPLVFPTHLNQLTERNVSTLDTAAEVRRVLAGKPSVVVTTIKPRNMPINHDTFEQVRNYLKGCQLAGRQTTFEMGRQELEIWRCTF